MTRSIAASCACLLIGQMNYARCSSDYRLGTAPSRQLAQLTPEEVQRGCSIGSIWRDLHLVEIRCPAASTEISRRVCTDGATIGIFRRKDGVLVNCRIEATKP